MKTKLAVSLILFFLISLIVFFSYFIIKNESAKKILNQTTTTKFDPTKINIDLIKDDIEFAKTIPEYKIKFYQLRSFFVDVA